MDQYVRPREAAKFLGIGRSTLYKMASDGSIPPPSRISSRCSVWKVSELQDAVNIMIAQNSKVKVK